MAGVVSTTMTITMMATHTNASVETVIKDTVVKKVYKLHIFTPSLNPSLSLSPLSLSPPPPPSLSLSLSLSFSLCHISIF